MLGTPGEVSGEIFDVDLPSGPVVGEQVQGHAPFLENQDGLVAVGGQRGLDDMLVRLARVLGRHQQPPRGLARFHPPGAFPFAGKAGAELTAQTQVALDLGDPAGQAAGIGERRPQVIDTGVEAVSDAHGALAVHRSQAAQDAGAPTCVAGHLVLLRSRFPRATSACRASSRCSHKARYRPSHSSISASGSGRRL